MNGALWFRLWTTGLPWLPGRSAAMDAVLERRQPANQVFRFRCDLEMTGDRWNENPTLFGTHAAAAIFGAPSWMRIIEPLNGRVQIPGWLAHPPFLESQVWCILFAVCAIYLAFGKLLKKPCVSANAAALTGAIWLSLTIAVVGSGRLSFAWIMGPLMVRNCLILYLCFAFKCKTAKKPALL